MLMTKRTPLVMASLAMWAALAVSTSVKADQLTDTLDAVKKSYEAGDYNAARKALDLASQLLVQKSAAGLANLLPPVLPGWTARDFEPSSFKTSVLLASAATRRYTDSMGRTVDISITGDSAFLAQIIQLINTPRLLGLVGTIIVVAGQSTLQTRDGDLYVVVDNRYLVSISGSASLEDKLAYAGTVDYGAIARAR